MDNTASADQKFLQHFDEAIKSGTFVKLTLSKPFSKGHLLKNLYARPITLKSGQKISFTYHYQDRDEVHNQDAEQAISTVREFIGQVFANGNMFTQSISYTIQYNRKRKPKLYQQMVPEGLQASQEHDQAKNYLLKVNDAPWLNALGITTASGNLTKTGARKFRQINKFLEIIQNLLESIHLPKAPKIVDMGSGKGYLTFALYDYLHRSRGLTPTVNGVELRAKLVDMCNQVAKQHHFSGLTFTAQDMAQYEIPQANLVIALHACDILTDIAIAKGIKAGAEGIIVAPCCHKQIRKAMQPKNDWQRILQNGILQERQAELLTDGMRSLLLAAHGYRTKVFEFISLEHTSKNIMITAVKDKKDTNAMEVFNQIKEEFGIEQHYLETLL